MKKAICAIIVTALISALFVLPASAKGTVVNAWLGESDLIGTRTTDSITEIYDGKNLTDAEVARGDFNVDGIFLIQNKGMMDDTKNTVCDLYFELDSVQDIDTVYISWFVYHMAIIGLPHNNSLNISYSTDNEMYHDLGAYTFEGETDPNRVFQLDLKIRLGQTVRAKYVLISFEYGPNNQDGWYCPMWEWVGITEVGAGLLVDEPVADPVSVATDISDIEVEVGEEAVLGITTEGGRGEVTSRWYMSETGESGSFTAIDGATGLSYTVPTDAEGESWYYCELTDEAGTVNSSVAKVTVVAVPDEPSEADVSDEPSDVSSGGESVPAEEPSDVSSGEPEADSSAETSEPGAEGGLTWLWIVIGAAVVIAAVAAVIVSKKKKA